MIHKKISFQNETYWLHEERGWWTALHYNISPLSHYDDNGNLLDPTDFSYAVLYNGEIFRHGIVIGVESDLKEVKERLTYSS